MATFDSAWCLSKFDQLAGRPDADEITDAQKYQRLAEGQMDVVTDIAAIFPDCLYQDPTAMSTSDSKEFTFGTDGQGHAVAPYGHVGIYTSLANVPDNPWIEGLDYHAEGTLIRIPNNRTYAGTLYWRGIPTPADMTAAVEPTLRPAPARILLVTKAVLTFAEEGGAQPTLADAMERKYAREFSKWMLVLKDQFSNGGALSLSTFTRAVALQQ